MWFIHLELIMLISSTFVNYLKSAILDVFILHTTSSHSFIRSIHSFIHSRYFYSASLSPLLLRGAPDYSIDIVSELTCWSATGNCEWLAQGPYVADRVGFESATVRTQGTEPTTKPPCSTLFLIWNFYLLVLIWNFYLLGPMFPLNCVCVHAHTGRDMSTHKKTWSAHKFSFKKYFCTYFIHVVLNINKCW